jgi:quercetin dioxygenase-like cupin family protein
VYGVRHDKTDNPEGNTGPSNPVQAFDYASIIERLRDKAAYENHGRSVLILAHEPSPQLVLTVIAAGRRTGERRVAGASTVQVLEGEVRFRAAEERHVLSAGGTLVLQGNVSYVAEAVSDAAFLHTLLQPVEQDRDFPQPAHRTEPAEGRTGLDLPGESSIGPLVEADVVKAEVSSEPRASALTRRRSQAGAAKGSPPSGASAVVPQRSGSR